MRNLSIPGPLYQCNPRRRGAIRSFRHDSRPSRLPKWLHAILKAIL